jgi:hypothetical protein
MIDSAAAFERVSAFGGADLTKNLAKLEASLINSRISSNDELTTARTSMAETLSAARKVRHLVGQVNVIIHALGILQCLPSILDEDEVIQYASLGAGNTGKKFDLETDRRIAEFKFITWQGGSEAIRQNGIFKDFYLLAEHETNKRKYLYLTDTVVPLKFLNGGRSIASVFSQHVKLKQEFFKRYPDQYKTVGEYVEARRNEVEVKDISALLPAMD